MRKLLIVLLLIGLLVPPVSTFAAAADYDVPGGHFFTQTGGDTGLGFAVVDDGQAEFWTEFRRLGGVSVIGYPLSARFEWDGFTVQVMQKGVLQWRPEVGRAYFVNVFDRLSAAGKDDWLVGVRSTPKPLAGSFDAGKSWDQVIATRRALLDANPAIRAKYLAVADPLNLYGLPTSTVVDNGNHYAIRLQRAVIQQWKIAVPWAKAGEVTVANGGEVGKEAGLFPADALAPGPVDRSTMSSRSGTRPVATATAPATPPATNESPLGIVNAYRALAGSAPLTLDPKLNAASAAHASYYVQNYGDKTLAGMGLHAETLGRPGFTGADIGDRAKAAGYDAIAIDEDAGLVGDPRKMIDWCMATVNHRINLLHPSAVHLGYGLATKPAVDIVNIGFSATRPGVELPTVYPGVDQRDVPTSSLVGETPDPAPGVPRPLGYPITISFGVRDSVQFGGWSLSDSAGQTLQVYTAQKPWLRTLAMIPAKPLRAGEAYTAKVSGTVNGQAFSKNWSFTTSPTR